MANKADMGTGGGTLRDEIDNSDKLTCAKCLALLVVALCCVVTETERVLLLLSLLLYF